MRHMSFVKTVCILVFALALSFLTSFSFSSLAFATTISASGNLVAVTQEEVLEQQKIHQAEYAKAKDDANRRSQQMRERQEAMQKDFENFPSSSLAFVAFGVGILIGIMFLFVICILWKIMRKKTVDGSSPDFANTQPAKQIQGKNDSDDDNPDHSKIRTYIQTGLKIISTICFPILMWFAITLATEAYISTQPFHPDEVIDTKEGKAYVVGPLSFNIFAVERMNLRDLQDVINEVGEKKNNQFVNISEDEDTALSMRKDNPNASPKPLIVLLNISNLNEDKPYHLPYTRLQLKLKNGQLIKPDEAWQEKLGEANIFSGKQFDTIPPNYHAKMMLIYPVPSDEESYTDAEIRFFFGNADEFWARKIDIPLKYKEGIPLGDGEIIYKNAHMAGRIAFYSFIVLFLGYLYMKHKLKTANK